MRLAEKSRNTSSQTGACETDFHAAVEDRDGVDPMTGSDEVAEAAHLIPFSKGDSVSYVLLSRSYQISRRQGIEYIFATRAPGEVWQGIDDVRNGLFLTPSFRRHMDKRQLVLMRVSTFIAFIKTRA